MSDTLATNTTKVIGYFNPQKFPIYIEISEINVKTELAPNAYIRDRNGRYINDPIFEAYCHPKGLGRATGDAPVPIYFVPRFVKSERPVAAVTQATGFVRQPDGRTAPTFARQGQPTRETAINKKPHTGMTMEAARKLGFVGKPRLVPEDYGAEETTGAPSKAQSIPGMRYSIESQPKIKAASPLRPELTEADESLSPEERARRTQLQTTISQAATTAPAENFDPARLRPGVGPAPVPMTPPDITAEDPSSPPVAPRPAAPAKPVVPKTAPKAATKVLPVKPTPPPAVAAPAPPAQRVLPKKRIAAPIQTPPEPEVEVQEQEAVDAEVQAEPEEAAPGSGIIQPLDEGSMPAPVLDAPPTEAESGKRFVCAADGKPFNFRSELERHVRRNFPEMYEELMTPYPA